jgi:predicted amidophosphoribosyltransferase
VVTNGWDMTLDKIKKLKCPQCGTENESSAFRCKNQKCLAILSSSPKDEYVPVFPHMMPCPECKQQISKEAVTCPHCGYQLKKTAVEISGLSGCGLFLLIVGAIVFAFIIIYVGL